VASVHFSWLFRLSVVSLICNNNCRVIIDLSRIILTTSTGITSQKFWKEYNGRQLLPIQNNNVGAGLYWTQNSHIVNRRTCACFDVDYAIGYRCWRRPMSWFVASRLQFNQRAERSDYEWSLAAAVKHNWTLGEPRVQTLLRWLSAERHVHAKLRIQENPFARPSVTQIVQKYTKSWKWFIVCILLVHFLFRVSMRSCTKLDISMAIRPSHSGIASKQLNISSKFFHLRVASSL